MSPVYVLDPTAADPLSKVRGIGRYLQVLRETFAKEFTFTDNIKDVPFESVFINPFFNLLQHPFIMKRVAKQQIAVIHDLVPLKYPHHFPIGIKGKINVFLGKLALRNYDTIITDSEASKKDIVEILKIKNKIHVAYPPISQIFYENIPTHNSRPTTHDYFIYVGDATWNKNLVNLAKAIQIANITCVFVGKVFSTTGTEQELPVGGARRGAPSEGLSFVDGAAARQDPRKNLWQQELYDFLKITNGDKRFIFPGFISDKELVNLYKNAVANILVSRDEGFGYSYFEASSQSTSSLLSDIPVLRETADETAVFANPNDPNDIANKILQFIADPALRSKLGSLSHERLKNFSTDSFKHQFQTAITTHSTPGV